MRSQARAAQAQHLLQDPQVALGHGDGTEQLLAIEAGAVGQAVQGAARVGRKAASDAAADGELQGFGEQLAGFGTRAGGEHALHVALEVGQGDRWPWRP